jgi:DNA-binding protein Fis
MLRVTAFKISISQSRPPFRQLGFSVNKTSDLENCHKDLLDAKSVILAQFKRFPLYMDVLFEEIECALIKWIMKECEGNCHKAAKMLGLNRTTLIEKRKRYGLLK